MVQTIYVWLHMAIYLFIQYRHTQMVRKVTCSAFTARKLMCATPS